MAEFLRFFKQSRNKYICRNKNWRLQIFDEMYFFANQYFGLNKHKLIKAYIESSNELFFDFFVSIVSAVKKNEQKRMKLPRGFFRFLSETQ